MPYRKKENRHTSSIMSVVWILHPVVYQLRPRIVFKKLKDQSALCTKGVVRKIKQETTGAIILGSAIESIISSAFPFIRHNNKNQIEYK